MISLRSCELISVRGKSLKQILMYELIIIAKTEDAEGKVEKHLKDLAATDIKAQKMGRKQLAYPILKVTEAEYFAWTFDALGEGIVQLNSRLRQEQDAVLRYLITIAPKVSRKAKVSSVSSVSSEEVKEEKAKPKVTVTTKIREAKKDEKVKKVKKGKSK